METLMRIWILITNIDNYDIDSRNHKKYTYSIYIYSIMYIYIII